MVSIDDAHAALLANSSLQFDMAAATAKTDTGFHWPLTWGLDPTPAVWVVIGLTALTIVILTARAMIRNRRQRVPAAAPASEAAPVIPLALAQMALSDADAFAEAGRFLDGAHVLLACGIGEIARGFPQALRPATTSRDIAAMAGLPEPIRTAFSRIADVVELGLFAGRPLGREHYDDCRAVFLASALGTRT